MKQKFNNFFQAFLDFFEWLFSETKPALKPPSPHAPKWDSPCVGCEPNLDKVTDTLTDTTSGLYDQRPFNHLTTDQSEFQIPQNDMIDSLRYSMLNDKYSTDPDHLDIEKHAEEVLKNLDESDGSAVDTYIYTGIVQKPKPKKKAKKAKTKPKKEKPKSKKKTKKGKK